MSKPIANQPGYHFNPVSRRWESDETKSEASTVTVNPKSSTVSDEPFEINVNDLLDFNNDFHPYYIEPAKSVMSELVEEIRFTMDANPDFLPPVDNIDMYGHEALEAQGEEYYWISSLSDLRSPENAKSNCVIVSESINDAIDRLEMDFHENKVIFMELTPEEQESYGLNVHYANFLQARDDKPGFVVDYTFSQIDPGAPFPFIAEPHVWIRAVKQGLEKKSVKSPHNL